MLYILRTANIRNVVIENQNKFNFNTIIIIYMKCTKCGKDRKKTNNKPTNLKPNNFKLNICLFCASNVQRIEHSQNKQPSTPP